MKEMFVVLTTVGTLHKQKQTNTKNTQTNVVKDCSYSDCIDEQRDDNCFESDQRRRPVRVRGVPRALGAEERSGENSSLLAQEQQ
jgi:hypothetical protein